MDLSTNNQQSNNFQQESLKNLSQKWLDNNVFHALEKIEEHERLMRNGCQDIFVYILSPNHQSAKTLVLVLSLIN